MDEQEREVILNYPAIWWQCVECGHEQYQRCPSFQPEELTAEQEAELRSQFELDAWQPLPPVVLSPSEVTCAKCLAMYETEPAEFVEEEE